MTTVATAGTALLSLSFVFAVTTQEFLGSCIFLFVKHPYDVGDRIEISGTQMLVERISLLYTVFSKTAQNQTTQVPNIVLNNLWIDNVSRSKAMAESIEVDVSYDTSFEDIELLRLEMEKFVRHADNSRDFQPDFSIGVGSVGNLDKLTLQISIQHKSNWHNGIVRATRRSKFMCALALALKKVPIYGPGGGGEALGGPTNPSYSVAVTDQWAEKSRDDATKVKEAARLVPTNTSQTQEEAQELEQQAASELNTRALAVETTGLWDLRDDRSFATSREHSLDVQRSKDVESVRHDLLKKESQRGRRKAGEGLSALSPTDSSTQGHNSHSPRLETFDEEAQTGFSSRFYSVNRGNRSSAAAPVPEEDEQGLYPVATASSRQGTYQSHQGPHGPAPAYRQ